MNKSVYKCLLPIWDLSFIFWFITAFIYGNSQLVTLALYLFLGLSVVILILKGQPKFSAVFVFYSIFIFICWLNIRLGYSISDSTSNAMISTMLKSLLFMYFAYYYMTMRGVDRFADIFIKSTVLCSIILYAMNFIYTGALVFRDGGMFNANALAVADAFAICYLICKRKTKGLIDISVICLLALFCISSGTRKAILTVVVILSVYICIKNPRKLFRNGISLMLIFCVAYFALMKIPFLYNAIGNRVESFIVMLEGGTGDASSESRKLYIELALDHFERRPILGHGINTFRTLQGAYGNYAHNNYVEILFDVGVLGIINYYLIHFWLLLSGIVRYVKYRSQNALISIAFIMATLVNDIAWVSYYERTLMMFVLICCLLSRKESCNNE